MGRGPSDAHSDTPGSAAGRRSLKLAHRERMAMTRVSRDGCARRLVLACRLWLGSPSPCRSPRTRASLSLGGSPWPGPGSLTVAGRKQEAAEDRMRRKSEARSGRGRKSPTLTHSGHSQGCPHSRPRPPSRPLPAVPFFLRSFSSPLLPLQAHARPPPTSPSYTLTASPHPPTYPL